MVEKLPRPLLNDSQLKKKRLFNSRSLFVAKCEPCPVTIGELLLIECKLFPDFYKHGIFKCVVALSTIDKQITTSYSNKIIIWKGNFATGITSFFLIA